MKKTFEDFLKEELDTDGNAMFNGMRISRAAEAYKDQHTEKLKELAILQSALLSNGRFLRDKKSETLSRVSELKSELGI